jgi:hypothetical protein
MRTKQKAFGCTLLWLFAAILSFAYLAPNAAPLSQQKAQFVILEDNGTDYQGDLLRSSDTQQEGTKQHNDIQITQVELYHSDRVNVRAAQIADLENASRPTSCIYIFNSSFLI